MELEHKKKTESGGDEKTSTDMSKVLTASTCVSTSANADAPRWICDVTATCAFKLFESRSGLKR